MWVQCLKGNEIMGKLIKLLFVLTILYYSNTARATTPTTYDCTLNDEISVAECETLVSIYLSTQGETWHNSENSLWLKNNRPCSWEGITCWGSKVSLVELPNFGLRGTLPHLGGLIHLTQLGLFENPELTGPIPDLTVLPELAVVIIYKTAISGLLPDAANMPKLNELVLHSNNLSGPIPDMSQLEKLVLHGNDLCLVNGIDYQGVADQVDDYTTCESVHETLFKGYLDVTEIGAIPDDGKPDNNSINHALNMLKLSLPPGEKLRNLTVFFPSGVYHLDKSIQLVNFDTVTFIGRKINDAPSVLLKTPLFGNGTNRLVYDYREASILDFRYGQNLKVEFLSLKGQTASLHESHVWWENGIYIGSSHNTHISENKFYDFGDSALTISTDPADTTDQIDSTNHLVSNNYFYNITQTSTTSTKGGSSNYSFVGNTVEHIKGSIKFATRKAGASHLKITNNTIISAGVGSGISTNNGFEIEGYSKIYVSNNTLTSGDGVGIVIRSAQNKNTESGHDWGDVFISGNHISKYRQGIYVSNLPHASDDLLGSLKNIFINDNQIVDMWNGDNQAGIHLVGQQFSYAYIHHNSIVGGRHSYWAGESQDPSWLSARDNTITP